MPEWTGKIIGKVRIEQKLAKGGMAEVYLGTHLTLERPVAVKVMHNYIEANPELQSRFAREARVVAALRHPNIVQIFDFDTADGHPYIVMEYLRGPSLAAYLRELNRRHETLQPAQIARLLATLAAAIDYAHEQGVIHRDIKPSNIILHNKTARFSADQPLPEATDPVITDFGLVRIANSTTQTASGLVSGTPAYMSPEQARGLRVDHRSDIYSLGIILYELIAGRVPFEADTTWTVIFKHINEPPPPIPGIGPPVQRVIERVLAKDPESRYQSCRELAADYADAIAAASDLEPTRTTLPAASQLVSDTSAAKREQPKGRVWTRLAGVTLGIVLLCFISLGVWQRLAQTWAPTGPATEPPAPAETSPPVEETTAVPVDFPPAPDGNPVGVLRFQDGAATLDQITIFASLAVPPAGSRYQAWIVGDGGELRRSLGLLTQDETGQFTLAFVDPESRNLMSSFNRMEITLEPDPDDNPNPSVQVIYSSEIPSQALPHIRHLLVSIEDTPSEVALVHGLAYIASLIAESAEAMLTAFDGGDEPGVRANAETIINLIAGSQDTSLYGDWDGDGTTSDTGDGYGLLLNGDQSGYVLGTISHAGYAAEAQDSTPDIRLHADHVIISGQNVEAWAPELRDTAIEIVQAPFDEGMREDISRAVALANQILYGLDIDGNESIDPIPGEGGVLTIYEHAYYMADMQILPGINQIPAP